MNPIRTLLFQFLFLLLLNSNVFCQGYRNLDYNTVDDSLCELTVNIHRELPNYIFSIFFVFDTLDNTKKVTRIEVRRESSNRIIQYLKMPIEISRFNPDRCFAADMNFDGYSDLLIGYNDGSAGGQYCVWLYRPKTGKFIFNNDLSDLRDPDPDSTTKTITSYYASGISGCSIYTHCIKNYKLILLREEETENDIKTNQSIKTIKIFRNGKIISIKVDTTSF